MSGIDDVVADLEQTFSKEIKARHVLDSVPGELSDFPSGVHPDLQAILKQGGIESLYSHQADAFEQITNPDMLHAGVLLDGEVKVPDITMHEIEILESINPPPEDEEQKKLNRRLAKASEMMKAKRARSH